MGSEREHILKIREIFHSFPYFRIKGSTETSQYKSSVLIWSPEGWLFSYTEFFIQRYLHLFNTVSRFQTIAFSKIFGSVSVWSCLSKGHIFMGNRYVNVNKFTSHFSRNIFPSAFSSVAVANFRREICSYIGGHYCLSHSNECQNGVLISDRYTYT